MLTYTALTTLPGKSQAEALGEALEELDPEPTGVGVFEVEDGKGIWEVGGYFLDAPDDDTSVSTLAVALIIAFNCSSICALYIGSVLIALAIHAVTSSSVRSLKDVNDPAGTLAAEKGVAPDQLAETPSSFVPVISQ